MRSHVLEVCEQSQQRAAQLAYVAIDAPTIERHAELDVDGFAIVL